MTPNLQTLSDIATQTAATVLIGVACWALQRAGAHFSALANNTQQGNFATAINKSLATAFDSCAGAIARYGSDHPTVVPMLIEEATATLMQRFPKTIAAVGAKKPADLDTAVRRVLATLPVVPPASAKQQPATLANAA